MAEAARAFWTVAAGRGAILPEALPARGPDDVRVRTAWSGISRGTEALVFRGGVPPAEHARMRCPWQSGDFPFPVKYGYAAVGVVEEGPEGVCGRTVFCLHPHQDRFVVPAAAVVPVPGDVPSRRAVLAANVETAVNALWDSPVLPGQRVAVIGAGVVGAAVARLAAGVPGTDVTLVDRDPAKAALAAAIGVGFAPPAEAPVDCDAVFEATGAPEALATAVAAAGDEAVVTVLSWYGDRAASLPLGGAFHSRRLVLRSSQVGRVAPTQRPRWTHARRLGLALRLLADPVFDHLLGEETEFAALPDAMRRFAAASAGALCPLVRYP
ncbi:MAG: zinc-binding alcohol dehydrogenase [Alphaproteobacteria bacterium]